jgi:hypothetical protein
MCSEVGREGLSGWYVEASQWKVFCLPERPPPVVK